MSGKEFAQLNGSLLKSRKLATCDHAQRWAYVCAHLTPLASYSGQFSYPLVMWAQDAALDVDALRDAVKHLVSVGLVEYHFEDEFIRIVGYFRKRPPQNASQTISLLADFSTVAFGCGRRKDMQLRGIAELLVGASQRAQGWKPNSPEWGKLREAIKDFMRTAFEEYGTDFLDAILREFEFAGKAAIGEIEMLLPPLMEARAGTVAAQCQDRCRIQDEDQTIHIPDEKKEKEEKDTTPTICAVNAQTSDETDRSHLHRMTKSETVNKCKGPLPETLRTSLAKRNR